MITSERSFYCALLVKDSFMSQHVATFCWETFRAVLLADKNVLLSDLLFSCIILGVSIKKVFFSNNHFFIHRSYSMNG